MVVQQELVEYMLVIVLAVIVLVIAEAGQDVTLIYTISEWSILYCER